jgi:hypothetical protein
MKEKSLSFPFISFFETGLFSGLPLRQGALGSDEEEHLTHISGFGNNLHSSLEAVGAYLGSPFPFPLRFLSSFFVIAGLYQG